MKVLGNSPHVLVVDDDIGVCQAVAAVLAARGYAVSQAHNGATALAALNSNQVHLVVLDVELGEDWGIDVLEKIKAAAPSVHVVMFTGLGYEEETWVAARALGAAGYVSKGLPLSQLVMEVDRWLRFR